MTWLKTSARLVCAVALSVSVSAQAGDFLVTVAKPDRVYLIDAENQSVVRDCQLPGSHMSPAVIAMSPDNKIAYVLADRWENVYGIELDSCEVVFSAIASRGDTRAKVIGSLAVSADGKELYTVQNPTRILRDRYEVLEPVFAVYDTSAGLKANPVRTFPAPRRVTVMAAGETGQVYAAGHEIYAIDPQTGETTISIANASWDRPTYSGPDVLAFWPIGTQNNEFMLLYTAAVFTDDSQQELADFVWGYESVDLATGNTEIDDFASIEVLMFSGVRNPHAPNELYGVYTQLSKHDLATDTLIKRVDLPHTYYCINISTDGKRLYVGGTQNDIGIYDSETLERIGEINLPSGGDMGTATLQIFSADT